MKADLLPKLNSLHSGAAFFRFRITYSALILCCGVDLLFGAPALLAANDISVLPRTGQRPPEIVFASDQSTSELASLLSQSEVLGDLQKLNAGIALALPDLSPERARLVAQLNQAGIPVTAWLALSEGQGYYLNAGNEPAAALRFAEFVGWSTQYHLHWDAIGLDIEPSLQEFAALRDHKWRLAATLLRRYFDTGRPRRARESYAALISEIQSHGYLVESCQFPFIADERKVHSTLLERVAGIVDVRPNREVLMLYSSFHPAFDSALIWVYGPEAQAIAVGVTTGPDLGARFHPLSWEELSRDLLVAHHFSNEIGIYSLEGCIRQGFLSRLTTMNWDQTVAIPAESVGDAVKFRARIQRAIWAIANLQWIFAIFIILIIGLVTWRRHVRLARSSSHFGPMKSGHAKELQSRGS